MVGYLRFVYQYEDVELFDCKGEWVGIRMYNHIGKLNHLVGDHPQCKPRRKAQTFDRAL